MVGRSNVGKSSLINAVLKRKGIARVSQTPGKTQAIHFYLVNEKFHIVDLPGYGYAKVAKSMSASWRALINNYLENAEHLKVMFLLLDARRTPGERGASPEIVLTKSDKLSNNELTKQEREIAAKLTIDPNVMIPCSVVTKKGIEDVRREIASRI